MKVNVNSKQGLARVTGLVGTINIENVEYQYDLEQDGELSIWEHSELYSTEKLFYSNSDSINKLDLTEEQVDEITELIVDTNYTEDIDTEDFCI